jgi:hypothetical protein
LLLSQLLQTPLTTNKFGQSKKSLLYLSFAVFLNKSVYVIFSLLFSMLVFDWQLFLFRLVGRRNSYASDLLNFLKWKQVHYTTLPRKWMKLISRSIFDQILLKIKIESSIKGLLYNWPFSVFTEINFRHFFPALCKQISRLNIKPEIRLIKKYDGEDIILDQIFLIKRIYLFTGHCLIGYVRLTLSFGYCNLISQAKSDHVKLHLLYFIS